MESNINTLAKSISGYIDNPDKYVYPFVIKEKNGKERTAKTGAGPAAAARLHRAVAVSGAHRI